MSRIVALIRRKFAIVKQHVGTDHFGNKYYFIPEQKTWTGQTIRAKRIVEATNPKEYEYQEGSIPSEWDAWIRGRKKEPPTIEELLKNERYRDDIKARAKEVADREMALRVEEQEEGLVARPAQVQIKGHASARRFELTGPSEDPTSTANTFEPGSWKPSGDNTKS
ncbi:NADH dehydrogenase [ubiquinone] 1 alpha subcomplex assembly factor 2 isoform X1 [Lepisosteus oculatus]|uniref:NADH dehydrogenase [ubiquinone] 1 alpha subcomplex assembly factor 2 isoform X1 n=1 Tax=Lepisosteus oculatus TaxID=7918 RepID=UPI0003EACB20|nr:PREDICTED: mimitin, mitochondrial isoform X1 [Lepisosteus oculatus]